MEGLEGRHRLCDILMELRVCNYTLIQPMNKFPVILIVALLVPSSAAFAEIAVRTDANVTVKVSDETTARDQQDDDGREVSATASATGTLRANLGGDDDRSATATAQREDRDDDGDDDTASTTSRGKGEDMSGEHRSAVAAFVQSLLRVADRDGGIGAEVRAVAQSQNDSASTTAEAIAKVENRSKFWSFLFGTDWKNIGMLRSELAKSDSDAERLETALANATDASVKADLQAQITALKAEQAKVETFVEAHEKSFSLLGWFTKLFVSTSTTTATSSQ